MAAVVVGCGDETTFDDGDAPTYHQDVAPLLAEHCLSCHTDGNIAPMRLDDYASSRAVAPLIKVVTAERSMPPWPMEANDECQSYHDSRALSDEEIALLGAWADAGAPEGSATDVQWQAPPVARLDDPTMVLDPGEAYTPPAGQDDDYRCFRIDPGLTEDMFLTAYEVHPGAIEQVHHVVLFSVDSEMEQNIARQLDDAEAGPGYTCFGGAGTGAGRTLAVWAPGTGATTYPAGSGLRLLAGREIIMQVHYNRATKSDQTTVSIALASSVAKEGLMTGVFDISLQLPPNKRGVEQSAALPVPPLAAPLTLHGVYPHMHNYGRKMQAYWDRGGDTTCLADLPRYDFNWQQFYFYEEPVVIDPPGGGYLRISCEFDTSGATAPVRWGEGTDDEMCIAGFYATY